MTPTLIDSPQFAFKHRIILPTEPSGGKIPCLILLHGIGSDENDLLEFGAGLDQRLAVVSARGPFAVGPGQYAWFHVRFTPTGPVIRAEEADASRKKLVEFIREIVAAYGLDPNRIWISGFSQGGIMSASVALTAPESVTGFAMFSGRILPEIGPDTAENERLSGLAAFVSHGVSDKMFPIQVPRSTKAFLESKGIVPVYGEYG